ncbi:hypothetical protein [Fodinibius sp. AD559]|uniref:hypothetical protein n=1 Tax=Fodinibius sp. AD559 TaxID=3424179 RepID=UPI004046E74E
MHRITRIVTLLLICSMSIFIACEGPAGSEGPQGPEGPEGPVGPAGEDGSMIYSGSGAPGSDVGSNGDYYLNTDNGEMYGPKDDSGWGNPIIVLQGEDGEDGSQIHSGTGAPASSLGSVGDYYLDKDTYELYGPKTDQGWGSPINLKGADGNANVTRYIYPGHDFGSQASLTLSVPSISNTEFKNSAWLVYLANDRGLNNSTFRYYSIPGEGINSTYSVSSGNINDDHAAFFIESSGGGAEYERIEIVRIEASNTEDQTKQKAGAILPSELDTSDYEAVAEYYTFYK